MQMNSVKKNRILTRRAFIYVLFLLLIVAPVTTLAQDKNGVSALRQMGNAFSSIAEKASPAVVRLQAEVAVSRDSSTGREWPFDDDLYEFFFGPRTPRSPRSPRRRQQPVMTMGTGFIISEDLVPSLLFGRSSPPGPVIANL